MGDANHATPQEDLVKTAPIDGGELAYRDDGPPDGEPVLLAHSLFFDHTMFDALSARLVAAGHRVVAHDHRGQGASSPAPRQEVSVDRLTTDAAALIEHLGLGPVHVAGNSLGGFVALRLAARRPDLLCTATAMGSSAEEEHSLAEFEPLVAQLGELGGAPLVDSLMYIMFGDTSLREAGPTVEHWRSKMTALGTDIADAAWQTIHRDSIVDELAGTTVPVLAIAGAEDHAYPPPVSDAHIATATGGRSVTLEGAGHSVALEQPDRVADLLLEHFAAASRAAGTSG